MVVLLPPGREEEEDDVGMVVAVIDDDDADDNIVLFVVVVVVGAAGVGHSGGKLERCDRDGRPMAVMGTDASVDDATDIVVGLSSAVVVVVRSTVL